MTMSAPLLLSCLKGGARRTCLLGRETVMSPKGATHNRSGRDAMEGRGNSLMLYSELMQYQKVSHVQTENTTIRQPPVQTSVARHVEHAQACNANRVLAVAETAKEEENLAITRSNGCCTTRRTRSSVQRKQIPCRRRKGEGRRKYSNLTPKRK